MKEAIQQVDDTAFVHLLRAAADHYRKVERVCDYHLMKDNERTRLLAILRTVCPSVAPYVILSLVQAKVLFKFVSYDIERIYRVLKQNREKVLYALIPRY